MGGRTARNQSRYDFTTRRRASCQFMAVGELVAWGDWMGWLGEGEREGGLDDSTYMIAFSGRDR